MPTVKSRLTKKQQEEFIFDLFLLFQSVTANDWAEIAGIPQREFYHRVKKYKAKKGGSK
jgi:hypothetical protein